MQTPAHIQPPSAPPPARPRAGWISLSAGLSAWAAMGGVFWTILCSFVRSPDWADRALAICGTILAVTAPLAVIMGIRAILGGRKSTPGMIGLVMGALASVLLVKYAVACITNP